MTFLRYYRKEKKKFGFTFSLEAFSDKTSPFAFPAHSIRPFIFSSVSWRDEFLLVFLFFYKDINLVTWPQILSYFSLYLSVIIIISSLSWIYYSFLHAVSFDCHRGLRVSNCLQSQIPTPGLQSKVLKLFWHLHIFLSWGSGLDKPTSIYCVWITLPQAHKYGRFSV